MTSTTDAAPSASTSTSAGTRTPTITTPAGTAGSIMALGELMARSVQAGMNASLTNFANGRIQAAVRSQDSQLQETRASPRTPRSTTTPPSTSVSTSLDLPPGIGSFPQTSRVQPGSTASHSGSTARIAGTYIPGYSMPPPDTIARVPLFSVSGPSPLRVTGASTLARVAAPQNLPLMPATASPITTTAESRVAMTPSGLLVPSKLAHRIWRGEYIEMAELLPERLGQPEDTGNHKGEDRKRKRKRVSGTLQWVECFNTYMGIVAQHQPARTQDLLAYSSLIVHAARKFKGEGWIQYDKNLRKHAETHPGGKWAEVNTSLWTLAFCNAQPRPHCELCYSVDHETRQCEEYDPPGEDTKRRAHSPVSPTRTPTVSGRAPICMNWNRHSCLSATCNYQHICLECHQRHRERDCPIASSCMWLE